MRKGPTVSVVIPAYNEECFLGATLESVGAQTYADIVEVVVADGRSTDSTRVVAQRYPGTRIIDNPARIQAAGLNRALVEVSRRDRRAGRRSLSPRSGLRRRGASTRSNRPAPPWSAARCHRSASGDRQRGIAAAMRSRLGAGPARFHRGGPAGWVDTVYLGAYRVADARAVGGYAEDVGVNEDAEFAIRMARRGGVWFEPGIRSSYSPRDSYRALVRQFYRYGRSRAVTAHRHRRRSGCANSPRPRSCSRP